MTIAFFGNFMSHHVAPLCIELEKLVGKGNYYFVACEPLHEERANMGYASMNNKYDFIVRSYESDGEYQRALQIAADVDVAILGSCLPIIHKIRRKANKLTFLYRERLFKNGTWRRFQPWTAYKVIRDYTSVRNKQFYFLGASAYAGHDVTLCGFPKKKCLKWGYFPEFESYDAESKGCSPLKILWCGRMIWWKHPEHAVLVADYLRSKNILFEMTIVGEGEKSVEVDTLISDKKLSSYITRKSFVKPEEIRTLMKDSDVYLFTSGREEGWGVVLNEAMNCRCAVIANNNAGSTPYLIKDSYNGFVYNGTIESLYGSIDNLLNANLSDISERAYNYLESTWSPRIAAKNLFEFASEKLYNSRVRSILDGPCSKAL